jgi:DnaK suppressor protein
MGHRTLIRSNCATWPLSKGIADIGRLALGYAFGSTALHHCRTPLDMTKNEDIAKSLKTRLSELTGRVAEIDSELRKPLSADSEERATDLENQDALEGIKNSEIQEIHQIRGALKRIAEGTYGVCVQCGAHIDPRRLKVLPIATSLCMWITRSSRGLKFARRLDAAKRRDAR